MKTLFVAFFTGVVLNGLALGSSVIGKVFVSLMAAEFPVEMTVVGNKLRLKACNAKGVCRAQNWKHLR